MHTIVYIHIFLFIMRKKIFCMLKNTEIVYPEEKIQRLKKVRKIYVKATTSTYQNGAQNVKIYSLFLKHQYTHVIYRVF